MATSPGSTWCPCLLFALLLLCSPHACRAAEEPFDWPGLSERGLILDALRAADPYNSISHHRTSQDHIHKRMGLHWVMTACDGRKGWSRTLASTIISAWASGVHPTTITVVWCKPYGGEAAETSLFGNLRLSSLVKVLYMPAHLDNTSNIQHRIRATYLMALNVPQYYDAPDLPLLFTEDDVVFAPDFNAQLSGVVTTIHAQFKGPYFIALYNGGPILPVQNIRDKMSWRPRSSWQPSPTVSVTEGGWKWGTQGFLFSASAVPGARAFFQEVLHGKHKQEGLQDWILLDFVDLFKKVEVGGHAALRTYMTDPSLVEHMGSQSSIFGAENKRFHVAKRFPFKVQLPADDPEGTW